MQNKKLANNQQPPVHGNVAIYARVATPAQLTQEHKPLQTDELVYLARQLGYDDTHIFVFEQDKGVSGSTPIDERVGLASIVHAILKGTIQAVLVADETRLFRDATAIQLNYFILVCVEHNAVVITPETTYDFSNPLLVKLFRFKCESAVSRLEDMQRR